MTAGWHDESNPTLAAQTEKMKLLYPLDRDSRFITCMFPSVTWYSLCNTVDWSSLLSQDGWILNPIVLGEFMDLSTASRPKHTWKEKKKEKKMGRYLPPSWPDVWSISSFTSNRIYNKLLIGSRRAYLSRNRPVIKWVSNYRHLIWTFCNWIPTWFSRQLCAL